MTTINLQAYAEIVSENAKLKAKVKEQAKEIKDLTLYNANYKASLVEMGEELGASKKQVKEQAGKIEILEDAILLGHEHMQLYLNHYHENHNVFMVFKALKDKQDD